MRSIRGQSRWRLRVSPHQLALSWLVAMVENCRRSHSHESLYNQQQPPRQHSSSFSFSSMRSGPHSTSLYDPESPPPPSLRDPASQYSHHNAGVHYGRTLPFVTGSPHSPSQHSSQQSYSSHLYPRPSHSIGSAAGHYSSLSRYDRLQNYKKTRSYDPLPPMAGESYGSVPPGPLETIHGKPRSQTMTSNYPSNLSPSSRFYNVSRTRYYLNRYRSQRAGTHNKKKVRIMWSLIAVCWPVVRFEIVWGVLL